VAVIDSFSRQEPPEEYALTYDEEKEWWAIVNRMPAEWFPRETLPMLAQLCRHVVRANHISKLVNEMMHQPNIDVMAYAKLLDMEEAQTRAISSLCTRMRLSQQAVHHRRKEKGKLSPNAHGTTTKPHRTARSRSCVFHPTRTASRARAGALTSRRSRIGRSACRYMGR
jgi:hypothetical protein